MKRNLIQTVIVGAMAAGMMLAQAPATPAQPPAARMHRFAPRQHMMQQLNLTAAQKEQAKSIWSATRQSTQAVREQLRTNREALATAVRNDNQGQIQKLAAAQGQLRGQLLAARSESMAKFYQILTPAQKAKIHQMHQAFRERMQQRFGRTRTNG